VRKFEIIFSPPNKNDPTLNTNGTLSNGTKLECIVMIREGSLRQKDQE
jgi:hypothetical protein